MLKFRSQNVYIYIIDSRDDKVWNINFWHKSQFMKKRNGGIVSGNLEIQAMCFSIINSASTLQDKNYDIHGIWFGIVLEEVLFKVVSFNVTDGLTYRGWEIMGNI